MAVNPARAGMIRLDVDLRYPADGKPRASGDDPPDYFVGVTLQ